MEKRRFNSYIIIPDVHGRTFWKQAVEQKKDDELVIFLGDYLEPYFQYEPITHEKAYKNFLEIIEYKKNHIDDCILLLGNHDFACISNDMITCRHDYSNGERNTKTFTDNMNLFDIAFFDVINDKQYMFSHAGFHKEWVTDILDDENATDEEILKFIFNINEFYKNNTTLMQNYLMQVSRYRNYWSRNKFGSCVWADVEEWNEKESEFKNTYQIFGHSQTKDGIITEHWADLDCRRAFRLSLDGSLEPITPYNNPYGENAL